MAKANVVRLVTLRWSYFSNNRVLVVTFDGPEVVLFLK